MQIKFRVNIFDDRGATITLSGLEEENWRTPEEMTTTPRFGESSEHSGFMQTDLSRNPRNLERIKKTYSRVEEREEAGGKSSNYI